MLRIVGGATLVMSCLWFGLSMRQAQRRRIALLSSSVALIRHARRNIDLFEMPTAELFRDFTEGFDEPTRRAFAEKSLFVAMEPIIFDLGADGVILKKFTCELGCGYKDDAIRLCDYCLSTLEDRYNVAVSRYATHKKLYLVLPLVFAVSVIVLLL